jgi:D-threo-aldose 1-dehydrogenase
MGFAPDERIRLSRGSVSVTRVGFGGASIGGLYRPALQQTSIDTVERAWDLGLRYFDTAPFYGFGTSERRLGLALADRPRDEFTLSTKVGRALRTRRPGEVLDSDVFVGEFDHAAIYDYRRHAVERSLTESLERLGLDRVDIAYIHDPDDHWAEAIESAYPVLHDLREAGAIGAIGVGMNQTEMLARFVRETDIDIVLCAGRYTLLDQSALAELLPECLERGVSVVIGGVLNSGLLGDPRPGAFFDYVPASAERLSQANRFRVACERHSVPLKAAAMQFPMAHPAVVSVLAGAATAEHLSDLVTLARFPIPPALWSDLRQEHLLPASAPTPS